MNELVSVIVPCYNQAQYLPEALESVLNQSYKHWECVIVNDGSPDNTEQVAMEWCEKDNRFTYLKKENGGLSSARNAGIKVAKGTFILPLDADDKIGPDYLRLAVGVFSKHSAVKLVYCEAEYFGTVSGKWNLPDFSLKGLALKNIIFCSAVFRKADFERLGPYDESFTSGREDWDFWISLLKDGGSVYRLEAVQFYYRKKDALSMVDAIDDKATQGITASKIFAKHMDLYLRLFGDPISAYRERSVALNIIVNLKKSFGYKLSNALNIVKKKIVG